MNRAKLAKLRQELEHLRLHPQGVGAGDLVSLAKKLGRTKSERGKEPTYVRDGDPVLMPPLSIPNHPGDMRVGTVRCIVDALLSDADEWGLFLINEDDEEG